MTSELGENEITQFLSNLATEMRVSASTQNQALSARLFLYRDVLRVDTQAHAGRPDTHGSSGSPK